MAQLKRLQKKLLNQPLAADMTATVVVKPRDDRRHGGGPTARATGW